MNPLTLVKRIQKINSQEASLGISEEASWHAKYKDSAYVFVGGIPFDLTEGDLLAVFAQYGEIVDVNLVRDKGTGKSKGFAFVAYEDQRSTNLAVDNLNGAQILGRIIRVDHVSKYKKKEEEDEETEQQKREERGVCRAFQRGQCTRGAGCKFSHNERRAANTGWGHEEQARSKWGHDKFEDPKKGHDKDSQARARGNGRALESHSESDRREEKKLKAHCEDEKYDKKSREDHDRREDRRPKSHDDIDFEPKSREDNDKRERKRFRRNDDDDLPPKSRRDHDRREEKRSRIYDEEEHRPKSREDYDRREGEKVRRHHSDYTRGNQDERSTSSTRGRNSSSHPHRGRENRHKILDKDALE